MGNRFILLICATMLLSGCASLSTDSPLAKTSIGMTEEQLVAAQSSVKSITPSFLGIPGGEFFCYRCDGQPTRTYINKAGNKVDVYFYWEVRDAPYVCDRRSCGGGYSQCEMWEQHFEFANGVVINEKGVHDSGDQEPEGSNTCEGISPRIAGSND